MAQWWERILRCPVCRAELGQDGQTLFCKGERRHAFDLARAGYVNLAPAKAAGGGDDAALIRARTSFLNRGHYLPIAAEICRALQEYATGETVLDAGCGEGYYALQMSKEGYRVLGIDLSKQGVLHAAKAAKQAVGESFYSVAGIFDIPVADHSLDAVVSVFAPVAQEEFCRVLKPGGILVLAGAGEEHLLSLKEVMYEKAYRNEARADLPRGMEKIGGKRVRYTFPADGEALQELFSMTPYFYRTSKEGRARLAATEFLDVDVDVNVLVYKTV